MFRMFQQAVKKVGDMEVIVDFARPSVMGHKPVTAPFKDVVKIYGGVFTAIAGVSQTAMYVNHKIDSSTSEPTPRK